LSLTTENFVRIGYVQFDPHFGDKEYNLRRAEELIRGIDADLLVLPELFNSGYLFLYRQEVAKLAEPIPDGPTTRLLLRLAKETGAHLVAGLAEEAGHRLYNSAVLVCPRGWVRTYRKSHLFVDEKSFFHPGDTGFLTFDIGPAKLGLMVCFDWIYPESARILALKGADIICHPANLVLPYCQPAMVTRCLENGVFAITANRTGTETRGQKSLTYSGMSQITGPRGEVICSAGSDEEVAGVAQVDPMRSRDKLITEQNDLLADRRTDLYGDLAAPGD
jgi:predicted amidohydrolase